MNAIGQFAAGLYHRLLGFYPAAFRTAFQKEMQEVFAQQAAEAAGEGSVQVAFVCLRELRDYPLNLLREHWLAIQNKEVVMATTGSASMDVGVCPRCGELRPEEARFCANCGRAFIPLPVLVVEQVRNFFNSRVTVLAFGALVLYFVIINAEWHMVYELFYPRSYAFLTVGLGAASLLIAWLLVRAKSNPIRLGLIFISMTAVMLFYAGVNYMDALYLSSEIKTGQPVIYHFLGLTTALERVEAGDLSPDAHKISYNLPACDDGNSGCLQSFEWSEIDADGAAILVERSWTIPRRHYRLIVLGFVLGLPVLADLASRRLQQGQAAAG